LSAEVVKVFLDAFRCHFNPLVDGIVRKAWREWQVQGALFAMKDERIDIWRTGANNGLTYYCATAFGAVRPAGGQNRLVPTFNRVRGTIFNVPNSDCDVVPPCQSASAEYLPAPSVAEKEPNGHGQDNGQNKYSALQSETACEYLDEPVDQMFQRGQNGHPEDSEEEKNRCRKEAPEGKYILDSVPMMRYLWAMTKAGPKNPELKTPKTLQEAVRYYADPDVTFALMVQVRWPNGVICQECGDANPRFIATRRMWECRNKHTKRQFSVKKGTIFEDSPIGLDKWFVAIWLLNNCKNGVSSLELHRALGVTQKTAWFMLHRIRAALHRGTFIKMEGEVEADETFIGGLSRNMHKRDRARKIKGTGGAGKAIVMGLLDRETRQVILRHVPDTSAATLQKFIEEHVEEGSQMFTDEAAGYRGLEKKYKHAVINHAVEYVRDNVHTNTMENFWSLLKRSIRGTYVSVEPFHLFRYLDEQAYRFNERHNEDGDAGRFMDTLENVTGKRLMYKQLIGANKRASTAATVS
jgi:transposase-like protein